MPVDDSSFRLALSQFATGVTVVLTRDTAGAPAGLTVNAFTSVSLDPHLVLICVEDLEHMAVPDAGRGASLAQKAGDDLGIPQRLLMKGLDGDDFLEAQVGALIDPPPWRRSRCAG